MIHDEGVIAANKYIDKDKRKKKKETDTPVSIEII
jgi:hypothetical protein